MNEPKNQDDRGKEQDFRDHGEARTPSRQPSAGGSFLRGCGIALGIAFLIFAFVVGACFISL